MTQTEPRCLLMIRLPRHIEVALEDLFLPQPAASRPVMGYHISIVGPFYWRQPITDQCVAVLQGVCARCAPPQVFLGGLGVFNNAPDDQVVYVRVVNSETLLTLREELMGVLGDKVIFQREQEPDGYVPHVTLALNLSHGEAKGLLATDGASEFEAAFEASEVLLVRQEPNCPWKPLIALVVGRDDPPRLLAAEHQDG